MSCLAVAGADVLCAAAQFGWGNSGKKSLTYPRHVGTDAVVVAK